MVYVIGIISVLLGVAFDQYTKYLATLHLKNHSISIIEGVFQLKLLPGGNDGGAWGILGGHLWLLILIAMLAIIAISIIYVRLPQTKKYISLRICLICIMIGAIGNMIDRIFYGSVVDFFYFELIDFPIFNVADIFVCVATFALIFLFIFYYDEQDFDLLFTSFDFKKRERQE